MADTAISELRDQHYKNLSLHSHYDPHHFNTTADSSVVLNNQYLQQPTMELRLPICLSPVSRPRIRSSWHISGGHLALWFCLILLQQPCVGSRSLLEGDTLTPGNASSPVNTFLPNLPLNARQDRRRSSQVRSAIRLCFAHSHSILCSSLFVFVFLIYHNNFLSI